MFVRAVMDKEQIMSDLFEKFMFTFSPPVVGVQEATLSYFIMYMARKEPGTKTQKKRYCFYCQTDAEGSAIVVDKKKVSETWMNSSNYWFKPMTDTEVLLGEDSYCAGFQKGYPFELLPEKKSDVWAVCGQPGRTFSAVVLKLGDEDILMLNVHSPNPAVDKEIKHLSPYDKLNPEFEKKGYTRQREWLEMLLLTPSDNAVVQKIQAEYERCEKRLIIVGDFNDASRVYIE
jgi:hypothetical protein